MLQKFIIPEDFIPFDGEIGRDGFYVDEEIQRKVRFALSHKLTLSLKNDAVFKSFFAKSTKESSWCRNRLLSAILGREVHTTIVLNPEIEPSYIGGKFPRLDLHCIFSDGTHANIELQGTMYKDNQINRSIFYSAKMISTALAAGENYSSLPQFHHIMLTDFLLFEDNDLQHTFSFINSKTNKELTDRIKLHYIELPKINKLLTKPNKKLNDLEFWCILIMQNTKQDAMNLLCTQPGHEEDFKMIETALNNMSQSKKEWELQFGYEKFIRDINSFVQNGYEKGESAGYAKGESAGYAKGESAGYAKGETAGYAKGESAGYEKGARFQLAKVIKLNMDNGMPVSRIANFLGITEEEVIEINQEKE